MFVFSQHKHRQPRHPICGCPSVGRSCGAVLGPGVCTKSGAELSELLDTWSVLENWQAEELFGKTQPGVRWLRGLWRRRKEQNHSPACC